MVKLEIQERDGFLIMKDFPKNCIFNKVKTGCGATTIALTNDENYIIAVPTTELVINKCYPPKDKNGKDITWKRSQIQAGVSPTNDRLFGLYGSFNKTVQAKLRKFLDKDGVKKIICTYDKVDKLIPVINPLEFKILVDEYHNLLKQYGFRTIVINQIIENFKCFKSHCFLTATPIPELFKPKVFAEMTEYVADWKTVDKITVYPYPCKSASSTAAKIIRHYKDNGYFVLDGIKSEEAYFFVNSVREIKEILEEARLTNDDCRIICADDETNHYKLEGFEISSSTAPAKRFTFITCKAFNPSSFIMDSEHNILITLPSNNMLERLIDLLQKHGETDNDGVIGISMLVVAAIYEKYKNGELYTEVAISENTLPYLEQVRPEMLKLYELLNTKRYSPSKKKELRVFSPITIDNGVKKITLDNSCYWLSDLLDNYLHIYLGVNSLEEAQQELKEVYSQKKGRKANNAAHNLIMYGTFHLLQRYSSIKTKSEQIRMTLDYMELLFEADSFKNDENYTNAAIAYLVKQGYKPQWKTKQTEDYNFSPNNQSTEHLW